MARVCQLKHEIVRFNPRIRTDYISVEDLLIDLKLTPSQLEIPIPTYFREGACASAVFATKRSECFALGSL